MTIVKGIGIMKKRCKMIIALLSAAMVLTACAKNTSDTDSNKANDTKTQDTSKDAAQDDTETEKTKEYQAKLDMIEPSAYRDARGLSLEEGAYISIIGKVDHLSSQIPDNVKILILGIQDDHILIRIKKNLTDLILGKHTFS